MWRNKALGENNILVMNYGASNLYSVDLVTKNATLIVSPNQSVGNQTIIPELGLEWAGYHGPFGHADLGDLYLLYSDAGVPEDINETYVLYMRDGDQDGVPEEFVLRSRALEESDGLNDFSKWDFLGW